MRFMKGIRNRGGPLTIYVLTVCSLLLPLDVYPQDSQFNNVYLGVRVSFKATKAQIEFINNNFDYVMTPFLSWKVRNSVRGPLLLLYRSIQGTWTGFSQFDWEYINSHENMFCHHQGERIKTIYHSWLMNGADLVPSDSQGAISHWINYYALTASKQVHDFNYDGLFIDSASHRLWRGAVHGIMPDDYSDIKWRDSRYKALKFIKKYFSDKLVIFNGLHSDNGAERSLDFADGGMWETFAFSPSNGKYYGKFRWEKVIELARKYSKTKFISIVSKKRGLTANVKLRMFVFASYLLVANPRVVLYISDLDYGTRCILYYPEYGIDLGRPLGDYIKKGGVYQRSFEKGVVLVNPDQNTPRTFVLGKSYKKIVPTGGGPVQKDGYWNGRIDYEKVDRTITVYPLSGIVLKNI